MLMRNLFNSPLGAQIAPLGVPKNIAPLIPAIIGAVGALGSAAISGLSGQSNASISFNRQKELVEKEQDWQKRMYDYSFQKESEYNSPQAAMLRYDAAGINPYLISQHSQMIGSGETRPSIPSPVGAPQVAQAPAWNVPLGESMNGIASALAASSQIKKNDAESFSKIVSSLPELGKSLGWDNAREYAKSMLGMLGVSGSQYERQMESIIKGLQLENRSKEVRAILDETFGPKMAEQKWALGEQALSESFVRIGKMASDVKVNDETVKKLASECIVNIANAWKLRREGEKYVADAKTINALREFLVSQARSKANMMNTQSYLLGAEEGTDIFDYVHSGKHAKGVTGRMDIQDEFGNRSVFWIDRLLNQYVKVLGSAPSGGSQTTTYYGFE